MNLWFSKIAFILITYFALTKCQDKLSKIRLQDKWYIDDQYRVRLFHGINTVQKAFPWYPDNTGAVNDHCRDHCDMTNRTQLAYLKKWGLNVVRLGFMWSGLYPQKGYLTFFVIIKIFFHLHSVFIIY